METVEAYLSRGASRVILGTSAVTDEAFLKAALEKYGERIAVGADIADGKIAIKGWKETSSLEAFEFCRRLEALGVRTVISTDISKDGAMQGANHALYRMLSDEFDMQIVASGGVSTLSDVEALAKMGLYGAIIGKAYYTGDIDLGKAIEVAKK